MKPITRIAAAPPPEKQKAIRLDGLKELNSNAPPISTRTRTIIERWILNPETAVS